MSVRNLDEALFMVSKGRIMVCMFEAFGLNMGGHSLMLVFLRGLKRGLGGS